MKKGNEYLYGIIYEYAEENGYEIDEHGHGSIGESLLVMKHNKKDITISFILVGSTDLEFIYECIYSDL